MAQRIHLSPPHMSDEGFEFDFVREAFASNYIAPAGPQIEAFEREMEEYLSRGAEPRPHCVAVSSGTAAIHLALRIVGAGPGDVVPCQSLTFIGSANPVSYQDASPAFIDSERETWNMDPELLAGYLETLERKGTPAKAVVPVHIFGMCAQIERIAALCEAHGAALIEDAAESLGASVNGRMTGTFGRFGVLSFNGNKIITTSGGGMLVCRDAADADRARKLATQARDDAPHYEHTETGYNYRMSNICAAIGRGQLRVLDARVAARRAIFDAYAERLGGSEKLRLMPEGAGHGNRWLTCLTFLPDEEDAARALALRERVRLALEEANIESRPVWKPMHLQPVFAHAPTVENGVAEDLFVRGLCLPSGTSLATGDLDRVADIVLHTAGAF